MQKPLAAFFVWCVFCQNRVYKQLIHDGFSDGAAQYAVDNMGSVDWNGLTLERAQRYYYSMSLSKEDVRKQLVHDGFTSSQAQYAVDNLH